MTFGSSGFGSVEYGGLLGVEKLTKAEQIKLSSQIGISLVFDSKIEPENT
jgi:hypothetical protein